MGEWVEYSALRKRPGVLVVWLCDVRLLFAIGELYWEYGRNVLGEWTNLDDHLSLRVIQQLFQS